MKIPRKVRVNAAIIAIAIMVLCGAFGLTDYLRVRNNHDPFFASGFN